MKRWEVCKRKHSLTLLRLYFSSCLQGLWKILLRTASHHAHILNMESYKYEMSANYCTMFFANTTFSNTLNTYVKKGPKTGLHNLFQGRLETVYTSFVMWLAILLIPSAIPGSTAFPVTCPMCSCSLQHRSEY